MHIVVTLSAGAILAIVAGLWLWWRIARWRRRRLRRRESELQARLARERALTIDGTIDGTIGGRPAASRLAPWRKRLR